MLESIFEGRDQALILGEVVGLVAEVLAEMGDFVSRLILNDYAIAGRARVTARATVAVGDEVVLRRILAVGVEKLLGSGVARVRHGVEFTTKVFLAHRPAARRVASRGGKLAAKIRSCAAFRL